MYRRSYCCEFTGNWRKSRITVRRFDCPAAPAIDVVATNYGARGATRGPATDARSCVRVVERIQRVRPAFAVPQVSRAREPRPCNARKGGMAAGHSRGVPVRDPLAERLRGGENYAVRGKLGLALVQVATRPTLDPDQSQLAPRASRPTKAGSKLRSASAWREMTERSRPVPWR